MIAAIRPWRVFLAERFAPGPYVIMVALFAAAHAAAAGPGALARPGAAGVGRLGLAAVGALAFFLKLRLYDELKDYEVDLRLNPDRPLARGLVSRADMGWGIGGCIAVELATFGALGAPAALAMAAAVAYSLLMYREFFASQFLRPRLTAYAVTHTAVSVLLSAALSAAFTGRHLWRLGTDLWLFGLGAWCLFNVFEFGRKTFASSEERAGADSYSRVFGRSGAVALVAAMCALSLPLLGPVRIGGWGLPLYHLGLSLALLVLGVAFAGRDRASCGVAFRAASQFYIAAVYAGVAVAGLPAFLQRGAP